MIKQTTKKKVLLILAISLCSLLFSNNKEEMNLQDCIDYAVSNNYDVLKEIIVQDNTNEDYKGAFASFFPKINSSASMSLNFGRSIDPKTNSYTTNNNLINSYGLEIKQAIFANGNILLGYKMAQLNKKKSIISLTLLKDAISEKIILAYADVMFNRRLTLLHKKMLEVYYKQEKRIERMLTLGNTAISDITQIRVAISNEKLQIAKYEQAYNISLIRLKKTMNYPIEKAIIIKHEGEINTFVPSELPNLNKSIKYTLERHPKILENKLNILEKRYQLKKQELSLYPSISLIVGVNTQYNKQMNNRLMLSSKFHSWEKQIHNNLGYYTGITISIPIFNQLSSRVKINKARNNLKIQEYNNLKEKELLKSNLEELYYELKSLYEQRKIALGLIENNRVSNESYNRKYNEGLISIIELQSSNEQLLKSEIELLQIELNYQIKSRVFNYYKGVPYYN